MPVFDRARSLLGSESDGRQRRYHDGHHRTVEDFDPEELHDPSHTTVRDRLFRYRWWAATVAVLATALALYLGQQIAPLVTGLASSPIVQVAALLTAAVAGTHVLTRRQTIRQWQQLDVLELYTGDGVSAYPGYYAQSDQGDADYDLFVPVKGFTWLGYRARPLSIEDLGRGLARQASKRRVGADAPAAIGLHPDYGQVSHTDYGTYVCQLTSGLDVDPFGRERTLEATRPATGDEDTIGSLSAELADAREEIKVLKQRLEAVRQQRDSALELAEENKKHVREGLIDDYGELRDADRRARAGTSRDGDGDQPAGGQPAGEPIPAAGTAAAGTGGTVVDHDEIEEDLQDDDE